MSEWAAGRLEYYFGTPRDQTVHIVHIIGVAGAAALFVLAATVIIAFDSVFATQTLATLQVGDIVPNDIHAPEDREFVSDTLTEQQRKQAADNVRPVFDPPDPAVARQQTQLARQILDYVNDVRRDPFATVEQRTADVHHISALTLEDAIVSYMVNADDDTWRALDEQIGSVLERVMRDDIRESDLSTIRDQLPTQVSVRFSASELATIVAILQDLVRPNTFENPQETADLRQAARDSMPQQTRSFERGQIIVRAGERIDAIAYEALQKLGLLQPIERRLQNIARALLASIMVMVVVGLYVARFSRSLFDQPRLLILLAALFLLTLMGARVFGLERQLYLYPSGALALLYVVIIGPDIAIIAMIALAVLIGLMANNSLEFATLIGTGGMIGALTLRRSERLNNSFVAGLVIALANIIIIVIFNMDLVNSSISGDLSTLALYGLINGVLAAAAAVAGMFIVTLLFNLPTSLKLLELSQPNQPLLQRLLREAPGTYQHSLQVANLSEQAANAIGADAEMVRVAALYHDIGKMLNAPFFVENQADFGNPHDALNDPYRSADIIISHVTEGDELARQYRLPNRFRDFIREHHGTTVLYFYQKAVSQAGGDESAVDIEQFMYPGPKPQTRETAIMMLADSSEAAVRARRPTNRQEIADVIDQIFEDKRLKGQLDESNLTLNDLKMVRNIFVEMLQAVFHPRINYPAGSMGRAKPEPVLEKASVEEKPEASARQEAVREETGRRTVEVTPTNPPKEMDTPRKTRKVQSMETAAVSDDDAPLPEVPPLVRTSEQRSSRAAGANGKSLDEGGENSAVDKKASESGVVRDDQ